MTRKFSLAYLTIPGTSPVDQIKIAAEAGYDFVSLRPIPMHLPNEPLYQFDLDKKLFREIRTALTENGIKLMDIELARVREDLNVYDYESAFAAGAELGATDVLSSIWSKDKEFSFREFEKICDLAAKYNLKVNLEFVTFSGITGLKDALEVLDRVDRPNAYLMVDTLHAHRSNVSPADLDKVDKKRFGFIHLCDGPGEIPSLEDPSMIGVAREGRLYAGEGEIDLKGMLLAMPNNPISIELPNSKEMELRGAAGHVARCILTAKLLMADIEQLEVTSSGNNNEEEIECLSV
ncbi:sugar phosphate isomerase/epimerase family protein [Sedimentibacter sp. MB31-C6]|uniref:sugar phosphate isomerase/epimerase family protein n=1 Tax=Sedimentibacter sp. MB31-C6 TaxID=3109366 RepID=UPI002DDD8F1B|nr:sugar phosphate isomerase/epimerase [Sedimentibacter sp. MB36-C1]WSI04802.1 sugar phosphate isomerase/epimerase [Sedimentibacter sp. MB36-C1]